MPHPSRTNTSRGAFLTEVLIALALLIPVVVLVAGLFPYSFSVDRKAWSERTAQSLARSAIEEVRGQKFETIQNIDRTTTRDNTPYRVEVVTRDVAGSAGREKTVTCTVSWPRKHGRETRIVETRVAKIYQPGDDS